LNLQNTTQLSESFPHTTEADTNPPRPRKAPQLYLRHTLSSVLHLNPEKLLLPMHPYGGGGTSGMTMDIRQTLLHHPEHGDFPPAVPTSSIRRNDYRIVKNSSPLDARIALSGAHISLLNSSQSS